MSQFEILADDVVLTWDMVRSLALSARATGFLQVHFLDKNVGELRRKMRDREWGAPNFGKRMRNEIAVAVDVLVEEEHVKQAEPLETQIERIRTQAERKIERLKRRHAERKARHAQLLEVE